MSDDTIPLAKYLWKRIASLGIRHVFGVPGDFNLTAIDYLYEVPELTWLGTCNELNGAYAADGYARVKNTPGALLTTYAVGELSAMNGVAGAYAEHAGMIHIVGMSSRSQQKSRPLLHHTLEPGMDQAIYVGMSEPIRKSCAVLMDDKTMAADIDRVIVDCVRSRLPVYIYVPMDVVSVPVDASRLETPLNVTIQNGDDNAEASIVNKILDAVKASSDTAILVDTLAARHNARDLARELVEVTHFPNFSTHLSRGVLDESSPYWNGVYNGAVSFPGVKESLESSDLVINVGPLLSDSNTGGFTREIPESKLVILGHDTCEVRGEKFPGFHFRPILNRLLQELRKHPKGYGIPREHSWKRIETPLLNNATSGPIVQSYLWQRVGRFLKPHDIVLAESGTAQFGMPDALLPKDATVHTQIFWSSIGYTVGGGLGACVAAKELNSPGRVIIIVGDGSLQMTVQEIGSYLRFGFKPIIFVINNDGYSIERAIHGPEQGYNDISVHWNYQKMLEFFGSDSGIPSRSVRCKTVEELEAVLNNNDFQQADRIQVCEVLMDKYDYPWRLSEQLKITKAKMAAQAKAQR